MITVKHRTQATGAQDPTKQVSRDQWNEEHDLEGLGTAAEANVEDLEPAGAAASAVASHEAANDPHPAYLKQDEGDARYASIAHGHGIAEVTGLQAALNAKQATAEKGQANGYASLGADGKVPAAQLPAAGADPFVAKLALASDVSTAANVTPVNVTGLSFVFEANSRYMIDIMALMQAPAATTGFGLQFDTSVAVTAVGVTFFHQLANTGTLSGGSSIADDASVGVSSGVPSNATNVPLAAHGMLITGANPGTAQLRLRSEVNAVATMKANSLMRVMKF